MHPANDPDPELTKDLIAFLSRFVTAERLKTFEEALCHRTRHLTIALEDIYQPHNASAVLRTCDCFGIQDVHIIENRNKYEVNPDVALGASKWLSLFKYNGSEQNTGDCLSRLKNQGYHLVATTPHRDGYLPENLPLDRKNVLIFGTELAGLSPLALEMADDYISIPMVGFTESLNISVSAAIFIRTLTTRLRQSDVPWELDETARDQILLNWLRQSISKSDAVIRTFMGTRQAGQGT